jgi:hypothetical protein
VRVLIDTPIWSLALRRRTGDLGPVERALVHAWADLVRQDRATLIGPVRQEMLSGIRDEAAFERLRAHLRAFDDESLTVEDFEQAARCNNRCRAFGVAGSIVDHLLCAVAINRDLPIFTTDADFPRYAKHLPIRLHKPRR